MTKNSTRINQSNLTSTETPSIKHNNSLKNVQGPSVKTINMICAYSRVVKCVKIDKKHSFLTILN